MEVTSFPLSGRVIAFIVLSVAPSLVLFGVVLGVARAQRSWLWVVPGALAAAALAPVLSTFFGVRLVIAAFEGLATGGGIGSVASGIWDATQPQLFASYSACALSVVTVVLAIRATLNQDERETVAHRGATITAVVIVVIAFCATVLTGVLFLQTSALIVDVVDPRAVQEIPIAELSQRISSRLILTAGTAIGMTLLLAGAVVVSILLGRDREPPPAFGRVMIFVALLAVIGCGVSIAVHRSWAARLQETALTGSFPR